MLNAGYRSVVSLSPWKHMICSVPIDEFFDHRHGLLPYRSLEFRHVTLNQESYRQVGTVNDPNDDDDDDDDTRISEFAPITGQTNAQTSVVYEYQVVGQALATFERLLQHWRQKSSSPQRVGRAATA